MVRGSRSRGRSRSFSPKGGKYGGRGDRYDYRSGKSDKYGSGGYGGKGYDDYRGRSRDYKGDYKGGKGGKGKGQLFSVLVRGLALDSSPEHVQEMFGRCGKIRDVYLPLDFGTRMPKGFGFVEFEHRDDALYACSHMDGKKLHGQTLRVVPAQDRRKSPGTMHVREERKGTKGRGRASSRERSP